MVYESPEKDAELKLIDFGFAYRSEVRGQWSVVSGKWCVVSGAW